jgi:hypothetical protein
MFATLMLLGLCIRVAALPLPGTGDVMVFKIWAHAGATAPVAGMYGVGGTPPERRLLDFDGRQATVDYPPAALYELALAGLAYGTVFPGFPDTAALTAAVKLLPVAAELGLACLLVLAVRRLSSVRPEAARLAGLACWLNPATLLTSAVLGYLDPTFALPAVAALVAASAQRAVLAGGLLAVALLTKPQAVLIAPVVALALLGRRQPGRPLSTLRAPALAGAAAVVTAAIAIAPVVAAGAWRNFLQAMSSLSRHDMLSGQAANVWWLVTWVMRAAYDVADVGVTHAFLSPVLRPLAISTVVELGYPNPRLGAAAVVIAAVGWGFWKGRHVRDLPRLALLGAWVVYAYFMLAVQVHENHFFLMLPLLAIAAAVLDEWRRPFWILSVIFALNLYLFYGLGDQVGFAVPRTITGIDATVWLSLANLGVFGWFAKKLGRCLDAPEPAATSGLGGIPRPRESSSR